MAIAVTGASGGVGSRVVRQLLSDRDAPSVIALARRPRGVPRAPRLTVRRADYDDPASLSAALAGVATLVFIASDGVAESMRRHHEHVIAAAIAAGVEHVVYTSIVDVSPDSRFYYSAVHRETEALIVASDIGHCLARTSIFADFLFSTWIEPSLELGTLALPLGAGRMALLTRDDAARALAAAAVSRRQGIVELTGGAAVDAGEICRTTEAVAGRPLRYRALEEVAYRRRLAEAKAPAWQIEAYASMFASVRQGRFEGVSADLPLLTGRPQETVASFIESTVREPPAPTSRR